jgi:hypothetical protein
VADPTTLTISIDRTSMSLSALVLTGHDDPTRYLSVSDYTDPAMQARITYAPTGDAHGDVPLSWSYQETLINFAVFAETATSESDARGRIATLTSALGRLSYPVTITVNGATPEVWTCRPGSIALTEARNSTDLLSGKPVWAVSIPAYPVRS